MTFHRLLWRVGAPFVLLVSLAMLVLGLTLSSLIDAADRRAFEDVAAQNGAFIDQQSLDASARLAENLRRVTGYEVFCRRHGLLLPAPSLALAELPLTTIVADGRAVQQGVYECVAVPIEQKGELLFVRTARRAVFGAPVLTVFAGCLLLATFGAWLVVRGLVGPLRQLARQLPEIESAGAIDLPAARRRDEIGDVARAFLRTREALREAQESRERMEKLAVLGRMTAALAHEVQNPVAAIRMHAQLWRDDSGNSSAKTIEHEAARIESMLNQWMYLTRPDPPVVAALDVGVLLARMLDMYRQQAEHTAVVITLDAVGDLVVAADSRRIEQVFRNLLTNAVQAMPGGGTLRITARREGDRVRMHFADSGRGFSSHALQRFAEFFFSEKEGGMGIGLSVASEVARAHGGCLTAHNDPGGGAVLTLDLPAAPHDRAA